MLLAAAALFGAASPAQTREKKPNVVVLMTDDTGRNDFGCYSGGGASMGHPTPDITLTRTPTKARYSPVSSINDAMNHFPKVPAAMVATLACKDSHAADSEAPSAK